MGIGQATIECVSQQEGDTTSCRSSRREGTRSIPANIQRPTPGKGYPKSKHPGRGRAGSGKSAGLIGCIKEAPSKRRSSGRLERDSNTGWWLGCGVERKSKPVLAHDEGGRNEDDHMADAGIFFRVVQDRERAVKNWPEVVGGKTDQGVPTSLGRERSYSLDRQAGYWVLGGLKDQ